MVTADFASGILCDQLVFGMIGNVWLFMLESMEGDPDMMGSSRRARDGEGSDVCY